MTETEARIIITDYLKRFPKRHRRNTSGTISSVISTRYVTKSDTKTTAY